MSFKLWRNFLLQLFTMACIDEERQHTELIRVEALEKNEIAIIKQLRPILMDALKTNVRKI
jgi:hypothetical protein